MHLIFARDESFWPPPEEMIKPHPVFVNFVRNLLITALYNYDQISSGRAEDPVGFLDVPVADRERYRAEIEKRG